MVEFYLKILSGNHIGAEIPLEPGRYSLGKDENCDLVLTDTSINEIELIIEITPEGQLQIQTSTADEPLYLNGSPAGSSIQCNHFDIVTSSSLFFSLGPSDAEWPDLKLPALERPDPEPEIGPEETEDSENEFPDSDADDDEDDDSSMADGLEALSEMGDEDDDEYEDDEEEEEEDDDEQDSLLARIDKKWLIAIPSALIIVFILILTFSGTSEPPPPVVSHINKARQIQMNLNLKNISLKELPDKTLQVSGYVLTSKKKREFERLLREKAIPFNIQVVAMNELRNNADALLKSRGYKNLLLELDTTPGSLVLTGYVATSEELDRLVTSLKQEIHGLVSVVDQVENQTSRVNSLKSMIREKGLSTRVHLIERASEISLQGHLLDEGQVYHLQELVKRFRDRYGNEPTIIVATRSPSGQSTVQKQTAADNNLLPSLNIRGISMGRVPYVVMEDGSKYLIGAKLANGYIIEDINIEYLLLTNGTDRIKYRLGGNRGGQQ